MFSKTLDRILHDSGLSSSPGYYSGRGACGDVDSKHLSLIYAGIEKEIHTDAAEAFVKMVAAIPVLSATDFLNTLSRLELNVWVWDEKLVKNTGNSYHFENEGEAWGTVLQAFCNSSRPPQDNTVRDRARFLRKHGVDDPKASDLWKRSHSEFEYEAELCHERWWNGR